MKTCRECRPRYVTVTGAAGLGACTVVFPPTLIDIEICPRHSALLAMVEELSIALDLFVGARLSGDQYEVTAEAVEQCSDLLARYKALMEKAGGEQ